MAEASTSAARTSAASMTGEEFLRRAVALVPTLRERAPEAERLRRMPEATVEDLHRLGLWRGMQPARWGGHEIDPATYYDACIELATGCASTGWVLGVVGVHSWQLGLFPLQAQEDVWGKDTSVLIASSYAPVGKVTNVEGGYRISGQWSFSSGCDYADWILTGAIVDDKERPGRRQGLTLLIPKSDYRIVDNWQVAGLSGSGSKAFVIDDAFVPEHRTLSTWAARQLDTPGAQHNPNPIFRMPFMNVFVYAVSAPTIGVAQGMLDTYLEQGRKKLQAPGSPLAKDSFAHARVARAALQVASARNQMREDLRGLLALAVAGDPIPIETRARARWGAAYALDISLEAVDRVFEVGGGYSIHSDNPMQRMFRDAHAMRVHASNNVDRAAEGYGRALLGLPDEGGVL